MRELNVFGDNTREDNVLPITNAVQLIEKYKRLHLESHYFDQDTLRFFGESISEMRLLKGTKTIADSSGKERECYVLSCTQKNYPGGKKRIYHYFDARTLKDVSVL